MILLLFKVLTSAYCVIDNERNRIRDEERLLFKLIVFTSAVNALHYSTHAQSCEIAKKTPRICVHSSSCFFSLHFHIVCRHFCSISDAVSVCLLLLAKDLFHCIIRLH
jgi:hypothetical protein